MTTRKALAAAGAYMLAGTVAQSITSVLAGIVFARLLVPEQFGRFALVLALLGLTFALLWLRLDVLIIRAPSSQFDVHRRELYFSVLTIQTVVLTAIAAGFLAIIADMRWWDVVLVASLGLSAWCGVNKAFFEREMAYRRIATFESGAAIASYLIGVVFVLSGAGEVALYLREAAAALGLLAALHLAGALTILRFRWPSISEWRAVIGECRGVWLDSTLETGLQRLIMIAVSWLAGAQQTGVFFMAQSLAMRPNQILGPVVVRIAGTWFGRSEDRAARIRARDRLILWVAPLLFAAAALVLLVADPVVPIVLGSHWRAAAPALSAMAGLIVFASPFEILRAYCLATRHARQLIAGRVAQVVTFVAGTAWIAASPPPATAVQFALVLSTAALVSFVALWWGLNTAERS